MSVPDVVHFFSYETMVSFELPIGFEAESEGDNSAVYGDPDSEGGVPSKVIVQSLAAPGGDEDAYRKLADQLASRQDVEVLERRDETIDGAPAAIVVTRQADRVTHQTVAQVQNVVFTISCVAAADAADEWLPAYDEAARSARFVLLPGGGSG